MLEQSTSISENGAAFSVTKATSGASLPNAIDKSDRRLDVELREFFSENCACKIWRVATELLEEEKYPDRFPELVLSTGENPGKYITREAKFWTCGFLPGSLYTILERCKKFPRFLPAPTGDRALFHDQLLELCRRWSTPLQDMAHRRDTHDIGFIVMPALRQDWELTGNRQSLESILTAAESLASRYDERVHAIRSWDQSFSKRYSITDKEENFLVIIDSMCNLDLLYYAGNLTSNQRLIDIATAHAHTILRGVVRDDYSTFHVCNFDPKSGNIQAQYTHQGYKDDSTWSRGQGWGILGFAQTYIWTRNPVFLRAAIGLADYFLKRLTASSHSHPYVPLWDFDDIPTDSSVRPVRDTSAAMIAANGMLLLHQVMHNSPYLSAVLRIAQETVDISLATDRASFTLDASGKVEVPAGSWDSILTNATATNNEYALVRYADHGLVYADYYFLELGNKILRMGLL